VSGQGDTPGLNKWVQVLLMRLRLLLMHCSLLQASTTYVQCLIMQRQCHSASSGWSSGKFLTCVFRLRINAYSQAVLIECAGLSGGDA